MWTEKKWTIIDGQILVDLKVPEERIRVTDPDLALYHGTEWAVTEVPPCGYFFGPHDPNGVWVGPESGPNWPDPKVRLFLLPGSYEKLIVGDENRKRHIQILQILSEVYAERQRQQDLAHGGDTEEFDKTNSINDWVSYITAYAGRAADKCSRNDCDDCDFRDMMKKVAALAVAAIEAHDKGFMEESSCWACHCPINNPKEMCGMCWDCYKKRNREE